MEAANPAVSTRKIDAAILKAVWKQHLYGFMDATSEILPKPKYLDISKRLYCLLFIDYWYIVYWLFTFVHRFIPTPTAPPTAIHETRAIYWFI